MVTNFLLVFFKNLLAKVFVSMLLKDFTLISINLFPVKIFACLLTFLLVPLLMDVSSFSNIVQLSIYPSVFFPRVMKRLEALNTMVAYIWWVFGFYWIVMGGQALLEGSPRLYW